jgi:hypothetical protein
MLIGILLLRGVPEPPPEGSGQASLPGPPPEHLLPAADMPSVGRL